MTKTLNFSYAHIAQRRAGSPAKFDSGAAPAPFEAGVIAACDRDGTTHYYHIGEEQKSDFEFWALGQDVQLLVDSDGAKDGELTFIDQFDFCEVSLDCPE